MSFSTRKVLISIHDTPATILITSLQRLEAICGMVGYGYELIVGNAVPATQNHRIRLVQLNLSWFLDIWRPEGRNTNRHFPGKPNGGEIKTVGAGCRSRFLPSSGARQPRVSLDSQEAFSRPAFYLLVSFNS
ncbi:hypothetical protein TNCV_4715611 [Trichonephila clavipes]|nr:hypothetical protein TNCV_4715611 [Trichonephila clavipes]